MNIDCILIDDDFLIRKTWEFAAKKASKNIVCFKSVIEFLRVAENYDFQIPLYLDQELGDGLLGVEEAINIYERGYHKIYLATGFPKDSIVLPYYILDVVGKTPPF